MLKTIFQIHLICIIRWFNESRTCPICRNKISYIKLTDKLNNIEENFNEEYYRGNLSNMCKCICSIMLSILIISFFILIILSKI